MDRLRLELEQIQKWCGQYAKLLHDEMLIADGLPNTSTVQSREARLPRGATNSIRGYYNRKTGQVQFY